MTEINAILKKNGLEINIKDITAKYDLSGLKKIKNKYTIRYKNPINNYFIENKLYTIKNGFIYLPRFGGYKLLDANIIDSIENKILDGKDLNLNYIGKSNDNQALVIQYLLDNIYNNKNVQKGIAGCNLKMVAGTGKTFVGMDLISKLNKKCLVILPNTYLLKQWKELLMEYFPNNTIGEYYGKEKTEGDIIVSIINSAISDEFNFKYLNINKEIKGKYTTVTKSYQEFYKEFGLIVFDESHTYCSKSFKIIFERAQSTYMLGLSATPNERLDSCDKIAHYNIGDIIDAETLPKYQKEDITFESEVHIIKYNAPDKYVTTHINEKTNMICTYKIIDDMINDEYRNKLILNNIFELFNLGLNVFVFSERRSHLEYLYEQFNYMVDDIYENNLAIPELNINENMVLYGGCDDDEIENAKTKSKIIFTSFQYSSTGVSINKMSGMILATPRRSKSTQIIGRIFRLNKENNHIKRIIVDIVDNKSVLKNQLYSRMKSYKDRDSTIIKSEINYKDIEI